MDVTIPGKMLDIAINILASIPLNMLFHFILKSATLPLIAMATFALEIVLILS